VSGDSEYLQLHFFVFMTNLSSPESAQTPGGIRLGTSALTSRNMTEADHKKVAQFLHRTVQLSLQIQKEAGSKLLKDFVNVATGEGPSAQAVKALKQEVHAFARSFPLPGLDIAPQDMKRPAGIAEDD